MDELLGALARLTLTLGGKSGEFEGIVKPGRTHLQDAIPLRLGQEFGAYQRAVERDAGRIRQAAEELRRLGIGGTAVGSGLNAHRDFHHLMVQELSARSGLVLHESDNLFESMQSMADATAFSASLRTLALTLIRVANDLRLLGSGPTAGLAELRLPAVQPGSSIMPGKVNPVMAEMLDMTMFHVVGLDTTIALASQAGQLELNVMMPVIAYGLFEMMHITINSVDAFTERCVRGLAAAPPPALAPSPNLSVAAALNPLIGYDQGAALVREAAASGGSIRQAALARMAAGTLLRGDSSRPVTRDEVDAALATIRAPWMDEAVPDTP